MCCRQSVTSLIDQVLYSGQVCDRIEYAVIFIDPYVVFFYDFL